MIFARLFRFFHLLFKAITLGSHQAVTVTNITKFRKIPIWIKTKYIGCTCGKAWFKSELTEQERECIKTLFNVKVEA